MLKPASFVQGRRVYHADTCAELTRAVARGDVRLEALARGAYPGDRLPAGAVPGVRSVGFWDAAGPQSWGLPEHRNEGIEFTFLASGRLGFEADGRRCDLRPGDLTITRPWQPHRVGLPSVGAGRLYWIILDVGVRRPHQTWRWPSWIVLAPPDLARMTRLLRHCEQPVWRAPELAGRFDAIGRSISDRRGANAPASRLAVDINGLLIGVLEMLEQRRIGDEPHLATAERAVELFLTEMDGALDQPWTLDRMAEAAGMRRTRFAYYVKRLRNMTPMRHLAFRRAEAARRLLREQPDLSITDVALACGFASSQYFASVYRRCYRRAPSDERRQQPAETGGG